MQNNSEVFYYKMTKLEKLKSILKPGKISKLNKLKKISIILILNYHRRTALEWKIIHRLILRYKLEISRSSWVLSQSSTVFIRFNEFRKSLISVINFFASKKFPPDRFVYNFTDTVLNDFAYRCWIYCNIPGSMNISQRQMIYCALRMILLG